MRAQPKARPGHPAAVATDVVDRIRAEHAAGSSLGQIARELTADQVRTAHVGEQWWAAPLAYWRIYFFTVKNARRSAFHPRSINIPVLIVHGTDDAIVGIENSRSLAKLVPDAVQQFP